MGISPVQRFSEILNLERSDREKVERIVSKYSKGCFASFRGCIYFTKESLLCFSEAKTAKKIFSSRIDEILTAELSFQDEKQKERYLKRVVDFVFIQVFKEEAKSALLERDDLEIDRYDLVFRAPYARKGRLEGYPTLQQLERNYLVEFHQLKKLVLTTEENRPRHFTEEMGTQFNEILFKTRSYERNIFFDTRLKRWYFSGDYSKNEVETIYQDCKQIRSLYDRLLALKNP